MSAVTPSKKVVIGFDLTVASPIGYQPAVRLPWWQRLWRKVRRQPLPQPRPIYAPGTQSMVMTTIEGDITRRLYFPHVKVRTA